MNTLKDTPMFLGLHKRSATIINNQVGMWLSVQNVQMAHFGLGLLVPSGHLFIRIESGYMNEKLLNFSYRYYLTQINQQMEQNDII